jgi:hypothetical protein
MLQSRPPEEIIADRALAQARHLMNRDYDSGADLRGSVLSKQRAREVL